MTRKKKESWVVRNERPMHREIKRRHYEMFPVEQASVEVQNNNWNNVCDAMIEEFTEEGLSSTVELIKECKI